MLPHDFPRPRTPPSDLTRVQPTHLFNVSQCRTAFSDDVGFSIGRWGYFARCRGDEPRGLFTSASIALSGGRLASDWGAKSLEYSQNPLVARGAVISQGMSGVVADDEDRSTAE